MDVLSMKHEIKALPPPWGSMAEKKKNSEHISQIRQLQEDLGSIEVTVTMILTMQPH